METLLKAIGYLLIVAIAMVLVYSLLNPILYEVKRMYINLIITLVVLVGLFDVIIYNLLKDHSLKYVVMTSNFIVLLVISRIRDLVEIEQFLTGSLLITLVLVWYILVLNRTFK